MLRGYRCIVLAAFGCLAAANPNQTAPEQNGSTGEQSQPALNRIASAIERQSGPSEHDKPCREGDNDRASNLCAQWKAADAAADSAWWAWMGSIVAVGSLIGVLAAVALAYHSNWIVRDTAKRQLRAYLSSKGINITPVMAAAQVAAWSFEMQWRNVGQTPATEINTLTHWQAVTGDLPGDYEFIPPGGDQCGVIGPGVESQGRIVVPISDLNQIFRTGMTLYVFGSTAYTDVFGMRRRTEACYAIRLTTDPSLVPIGLEVVSYGPFNGIDDGCLYPPPKN